MQYPGQTETEPFARVHVLLDDTDVVLGFQELLDVPNDDDPHRHAGRGDLGVDRRCKTTTTHAPRSGSSA